MSESRAKAKGGSRRDKSHASVSKAKAGADASAARFIDERIRELGGWRGDTLARMRKLIRAAAPGIVEEVKWRGTPVWSHPDAGIVCTGEAYAKVIKLTFARGASLPDPAGLFNASLDGNTRRAIDLHEGDTIEAAAFRSLIRAATTPHDGRSTPRNSKAETSSMQKKESPKRAPRKQAMQKKPRKELPKNADGVVLLSGGNPQIAKGDGDEPVQAYIAAMPGWKRELGRRLDALIVRSVPNPPGVRKAVRWNSPFYGIHKPDMGWFVTFHVLTRYVKVTFFRGAQLDPAPSGAGKDKDARWIDIYEDEELDEPQMERWVKQAAAIPGWVP